MSRFIPRIAQFTSHLAKPTSRPSFSTSIPHFARKMAPIPASQKVVQITENGPSDVLKVSEAPVPELKDDQVLVRNEFAGVNYIDTYFRTGLYKSDFPLILGREAAGRVVASHPTVKGKFADGARVVYMAEATYAQYTAVAAKDVIAIPDGVDTDVAVAAYLQGLTALTLVHEAADVQPDQWTYVAAAAGGVGSLLVQILGRLRAKVIASASTDEKLNTVAGLGKYPVKREHLLNSKSDDIVAKIQEITGGHGIDAVFDGIGKATFEDALKIVALKGNLVSFGNASGAVDPVNILRLGEKNIKLSRPRLFPYINKRSDLERYSTELFDLIKNEELKILIHKRYESLDKAKAAHDDIESRGTQGKLLIKID